MDFSPFFHGNDAGGKGYITLASPFQVDVTLKVMNASIHSQSAQGSDKIQAVL
jgi:hypothetical protein